MEGRHSVNDLISRAAALDVIVTEPNFHNILTRIEELPAVDAVPVVRCSECRHCYFASNRAPAEQADACSMLGIDVKPDWFCAYGERQDGDT